MKKQRFFIIVGAAFVFFLCNLPAQAITISGTTDAWALWDAIKGTGITIVGTPSYTGTTDQSGTFTDGDASGIGFDEGIVLTSGSVDDIDGANHPFEETKSSQSQGDADDISTDLGQAGDSDLDSLSKVTTYDAAVLEFDFQFGDGTTGGDLYFRFVFASEEYINFVNTEFNDVFGFFVDDVNVGVIPGTDTPITINNVNDALNSSYYRNNVNNTNGIPVAGLSNHFDGLTTVITAQALGLGDGIHTMKFAVADASDGLLDAGVFIEAGSFSVDPPPEPVPEPASLLLLAMGLVGLGGFARKKFQKKD